MKAKKTKKYTSKKLPYSKLKKPIDEEKLPKQTPSLGLLDLDDDCLIAIFEFLPKMELLRTERVSKHWRKICLLIWRKVRVLDMRNEIIIENNKIQFALNQLLWRCQYSVNHLILPDYFYLDGLHPKSLFGLIEKYCLNVSHLDVGSVECSPGKIFKVVPTKIACSLKSLSFSSFSSYEPTGLPLFLKNAKNLEELRYHSYFGKMADLLNLSTNIKSLNIHGQFKDGNADLLDNVLKNFPCLRALSLGVSFHTSTISSVSDQLESLSLSNNYNFFQDHLFYKMTFKNLKKLNLSCSICTAVTDKVIFVFCKNAPLLEDINLRDCRELTDSGFRFLENLQKLKSLNVESTKVSDNGLGFSLNDLENINCSFCDNLTDHGLSGIIGSCPKLKILHIGESEKATEKFFESATESLTFGLDGKKRRLRLYVCYNATIYLDSFSVDRSKLEQHNKVLLKMGNSALFDLHVYGTGKDVWRLDSDANFF